MRSVSGNRWAHHVRTSTLRSLIWSTYKGHKVGGRQLRPSHRWKSSWRRLCEISRRKHSYIIERSFKTCLKIAERRNKAATMFMGAPYTFRNSWPGAGGICWSKLGNKDIFPTHLISSPMPPNQIKRRTGINGQCWDEGVNSETFWKEFPALGIYKCTEYYS